LFCALRAMVDLTRRHRIMNDVIDLYSHGTYGHAVDDKSGTDQIVDMTRARFSKSIAWRTSSQPRITKKRRPALRPGVIR
jgi:hypothetical protein